MAGKKSPLLADKKEKKPKVAEESAADEPTVEESIDSAIPEKETDGFKTLSDKEMKELSPMALEDYIAKKSRHELKTGAQTLFIVPLAEGEKPGAVEVVSLNGYRLTIKKGEQVEIPLTMAQIIAEKYRIQMTAGQDKLIDRSEEAVTALQ